jgi:predicted transglutaminase-like cysteine proteinase
MKKLITAILGAYCTIAPTWPSDAASAKPRLLAMSIGETTRVPIGWVEFCSDHPSECVPHAGAPRDAVLTAKSWKELVRINERVNRSIKPMTDLEHHGVVEKWSYPDDGYGDCEDYVLLKQRLLAEAGWPRQALLITVVRDDKGEGHAVLTVKTDKGDYILDNQHPAVLPWSETSYRYIKRQSQHDPNVWVSLDDPRPAIATASSR